MAKIKRFTLIILIICFISCNNTNLINVDFDKYTMTIPAEWNIIDIQAIDSDAIIIVTKNKDSILCDYTNYTNSFNETNKVFSEEQILNYKSMGMNTKDLYSSDIPEIDQAQGTFLKEYYLYDTIDGVKAKIKIPKLYGKGETGICFIDKNIAIIGINLKEDDQKFLLESFQTIKFK